MHPTLGSVRHLIGFEFCTEIREISFRSALKACLEQSLTNPDVKLAFGWSLASLNNGKIITSDVNALKI